MNPNKTDTNLDYTALHEQVTRADTEAYKSYTGRPGFTASWPQILVVLFASTFVFFVVSAIGSAFGVSLTLLLLVWAGATAGAALLLYVSTLHLNKSRARLFKFASRNNITFIENRQSPQYAGMIFDEGQPREISTAFAIPNRAEIGNYVYVTGSGDDQKTHHWAYVKVKLSRKLPHMVLDAKKNNFLGRFSNLTDTFDKSQTLALEGDFNQHFTLYAPKQYERDALYVFTPDVMAALIDAGDGFDMEVIDDELYIYRRGQFNLASEQVMRSMLAIVDKIHGELQGQADFYADERVGDRTQNIIAPQGARLKYGISWAAVAVGSLIVLLWIMNFLDLLPGSSR